MGTFFDFGEEFLRQTESKLIVLERQENLF
jgi:hypothetical protein